MGSSKIPKRPGRPAYLSIVELAETSGVPVWQIRRREQQGLFRPARRQGKGRSAKSLYTLEQIDALRELITNLDRKRRDDPPEDLLSSTLGGKETFWSRFSPEQAKRGFDFFGGGGDVRAAVVQLGLHPETCKALYLEWLEIPNWQSHTTGGLFLNRETMRRIDELELSDPDGKLPARLRSPEHIVAALEIVAAESACACGKGARLLCRRCVGARVEEALAKERASGLGSRASGETRGEGDPTLPASR